MTLTSDQLNCVNELAAGAFAAMNVRAIYRAKKMTGVYWPAWAFYTYWGIANLYVYPDNKMVWSFYGGFPVVIFNAIWLWLVFWYHWLSQHFPDDPLDVPCEAE